MSSTRFPSIRSLSARAVSVLVAVVAVSACSSAPGDDAATIDRDLFVDVYVDLRVAALDADTRLLSDEVRTEVLDRHGVTEEELLRFADAHGREVEFMRDVWNDIELELDGMRPEPTAAPEGS